MFSVSSIMRKGTPLQITDCQPRMHTAFTSLTSNIPPFDVHIYRLATTTWTQYHDFDARDLYNYLINPLSFFACGVYLLFSFSFCHCCCSVGKYNGIIFEHYGLKSRWRLWKVTVCLRRTNMTLLCNSGNGAFLLNLPSHPRTAHNHALRCIPTRKGTQDVPGEPRTTAYCAISVEIVCGHIPHACRRRPLYHRLATTSCNCSRVRV
jgi:hypothetical protein